MKYDIQQRYYAYHKFTTRKSVTNEYLAVNKNTLRDIFNLGLSRGTIFRGCAHHQRRDEREWINILTKKIAKPRDEREWRNILAKKIAKPRDERECFNIVDFASKARRDAFQAQALAALKELRRHG